MRLAKILVLSLLALLATRTALAADVSGTWTGTIALRFADGQRDDGVLWMQLQQQGDRVEGAAGAGPERAKPIRDGRFERGVLRFDVESTAGNSLRFELRLDGGKLAGDAVGEVRSARATAHVEATRDELSASIAAADARLFDAYNRRDLDEMMSMFTRDLEFYHDRGGFSDYAQNRAAFARTLSEATRHRRELVPGSTRVSKLGEDFALQTGTHRFYDQPPGEAERLAATAQFVNVWQKTPAGWRLRRVVSYDHR